MSEALVDVANDAEPVGQGRVMFSRQEVGLELCFVQVLHRQGVDRLFDDRVVDELTVDLHRRHALRLGGLERRDHVSGALQLFGGRAEDRMDDR